MGIGDFIDGAGEKIGEGVSWVGDKAADGLDAMGADGAAEKVRDGSEWAADELGAQVSERQLGETDDPKELVHGDAGALKERAQHLADFAAAFDRIGSGMRGMDSDHWRGEAGDAFREKFELQPKFWIQAADACSAADTALSSYAGTVSWAQSQAGDAIDAYNKAKAASEKAVSAYNAKVDAWNADNAARRDPGPRPGEFHDPGLEGLKHAIHLLKEARRQRNEAAEDAQRAIAEAMQHAPEKPGVGTELLAMAKDGWEGSQLARAHVIGGAVKGLAGTLKLVRMVNPLDPYNITHPTEYIKNTNMVLAGLASTVAHPERIPATIFKQDWSDPFDAIGRIGSDLIGGKGLGSIAKVGARTAAKDAAKGAARRAAKHAEKDVSRHPDNKKTCGEPVDVATGRMLLPATDVSLPGTPPSSSRACSSRPTVRGASSARHGHRPSMSGSRWTPRASCTSRRTAVCVHTRTRHPVRR